MLNKKIQFKKKGFTLIEIIVVIFIIGIISSFVIVSFSNPRQKNRDVKRISDITQLQMALNTYYQFEGDYPESLVAGEPLISSSTETVILQSVPENPAYPDDDCTFSDYNYSYNSGDERYNIDFCLESSLDNYSSGSKCAIPEGILNEACEAVSFVCGDDLDHQGYSYTTIEIGDQCWFAENLKHLPEVHSNSEFEAQGDNNLPAYGVHDYDGNDITEAKAFESGGVNMYETYGVLYNWYAVDQGDLCPSGWHVPTDNEFKTLEGEVDSAYEIDSSEWNDTGWRGDDVGSKLAGNEALWDAGVLDEHANFGDSGFDALPAGSRSSSGDFDYLGGKGPFWLSSGGGPGNAWRRSLYSDFSSVYRASYDRAFGFSIRCLKD
jgi:uncharacterized protein (TIGR02145 family)/prepilin-type N-terminal cleavage/methylation domain-containing protein